MLDYTEVKLKDIWMPDNFERRDSKYDWKKLEDSIKSKGFIKSLGPKLLCQEVAVKDNSYKYMMRDGKHRMYILSKLYGLDYKIKLKIYPLKYKWS